MSSDEEALRATFEETLARRLRRRSSPPEVSVLGAGTESEESIAEGRAFLAALAEDGLGTPSWPVEVGGAGLDGRDLAVLERVLDRFERPDLYPFLIGIGMVGPILAAHGSEAQRARHLEAIRTGGEIWCQLFSEPEAGSDLASLRARAERDGDDWIVNGHKIWVSRAAYAAWGLLLARSEHPSERHRGLTAFILPMRAEGVRLAPIRQMNGDDHFFEVFLGDVRLPHGSEIGSPGDGWRVAMSMLGRERSSALDAAGVGLSARTVLDLLHESGHATDPVARLEAADVIIGATLLRIAREEGQAAGLKVLLADSVRSLAELSRSLRGPEAVLDDGLWSTLDLTAPSLSIRGGTDEIQLNVIAERVLGLPR